MKIKGQKRVRTTIRAAMSLQLHAFDILQRQRKENAEFALIGLPFDGPKKLDGNPVLTEDDYQQMKIKLKWKELMNKASSVRKEKSFGRGGGGFRGRGERGGRGNERGGRGRGRSSEMKTESNYNVQYPPERFFSYRGRGSHVGQGRQQK